MGAGAPNFDHFFGSLPNLTPGSAERSRLATGCPNVVVYHCYTAQSIRLLRVSYPTAVGSGGGVVRGARIVSPHSNARCVGSIPIAARSRSPPHHRGYW